MSYAAVVYKTMIASPSDVGAERGVIREVIGRWNNAHSDSRGIVLMPIGWDTHSTPEMGDRPQAILNKQILHDCDLLVGVFWTRIGTSTGDYASGSVEEIEEHMKASKPTMLYFSAAPVIYDSVDPVQYEQLKKFKKECQSRGVYEEFNDLADFRNKFDRHLQIKLNKDSFFQEHGEMKASNSAEIFPIPSQPKLSREAQVLLTKALNDGQILHLHVMSGTIVQVNGENLVEESSPRSSAIWEGAILELERSNLIVSASSKREVFRVTREGYELADMLST